MQIFGTESSHIEERIANIKRHIPEPGFEWYPYNSLSNLVHLKELLGSLDALVLDKARRGGVLDIGCQDGELSFLFEALGCRVDAIDLPAPNHNGMLGVRLLARQLGSAVRIHEVDLDSQFAIPNQRYGLALFLGILYHLKNPVYGLDRIARHADYCLLSTRVARYLPDGSPMPEGHPLVYLLDSRELNEDGSNYWIFSDPGLKRILKRTQWEVVKWLNVGDTLASDPVSLQHDERAFCLLRSRHSLASSEIFASVQLLKGWHPAEASGWRWTEQRFSARFKSAEGHRPARLTLGVYFPSEVFQKLGPVALGGRVNGREFKPAHLQAPGEHSIVRAVDAADGDVLAEFQLDKALTPEGDDIRELGVIVTSLEVE